MTTSPMPSTTETIAPAPMDQRLRRALYRATHRGTKELDWLVGRFAEARLPNMGPAVLDVFERFLIVPDPELHAWIMNPELIPPAEFAAIVADIRVLHGLAD